MSSNISRANRPTSFISKRFKYDIVISLRWQGGKREKRERRKRRVYTLFNGVLQESLKSSTMTEGFWKNLTQLAGKWRRAGAEKGREKERKSHERSLKREGSTAERAAMNPRQL